MKKLFFVALVMASLAACGGKKKDNTMKPDKGSGTMEPGSGSAPAGDGSGSAAPEGGGAGG